MGKAPELDRVFEPEMEVEQPAEVRVEPRISLEWDDDDRDDVEFIQASIEKRIALDYAQAFSMESELLAKVRTPLPPGQGQGWAQHADGSYIEDWSRISIQDMEAFIHAASSETFFASQKVIDGYAEAVYAKFSYEDAYDEKYASILTGTVGDKTAKAKRHTRKERWLALYKMLYYKKGKEVVDRLDQHVRRVERIYQERQREADRIFRASRQ